MCCTHIRDSNIFAVYYIDYIYCALVSMLLYKISKNHAKLPHFLFFHNRLRGSKTNRFSTKID
jgi:hypothetical protein